jgi:hypothetical protein
MQNIEPRKFRVSDTSLNQLPGFMFNAGKLSHREPSTVLIDLTIDRREPQLLFASCVLSGL